MNRREYNYMLSQATFYKKFNLNSLVKIKLIEKGKQILQKEYDEIPERLKDKFDPYIKEDDHGYVELQMYDFMHIFGRSEELVYETNILIKEKDLK